MPELARKRKKRTLKLGNFFGRKRRKNLNKKKFQLLEAKGLYYFPNKKVKKFFKKMLDALF